MQHVLWKHILWDAFLFFLLFSPPPRLPFRTSAGVTEVADHSDSNWTFDCRGGATSGRRGGRGGRANGVLVLILV